MGGVSPHVIAIAGPNGAGKTTLAPFLAVQRVRERVRSGGHDVAEDVIRRRYAKGARNFFTLYSGLADTWGIYDNSSSGNPVEIAIKNKNTPPQILREDLWRRLREAAAIT